MRRMSFSSATNVDMSAADRCDGAVLSEPTGVHNTCKRAAFGHVMQSRPPGRFHASGPRAVGEPYTRRHLVQKLSSCVSFGTLTARRDSRQHQKSVAASAHRYCCSNRVSHDRRDRRSPINQSDLMLSIDHRFIEMVRVTERSEYFETVWRARQNLSRLNLDYLASMVLQPTAKPSRTKPTV